MRERNSEQQESGKYRFIRWTIYFLLLVIIVAGVSMFIITSSVPYEETKSFWRPAQFNIANLVDGKYVPIAMVNPSGTLNYVTLDEFKRRFADKKSEIIIRQDSRIYYLHKTDTSTFIATEVLAPVNHFVNSYVTDADIQGQIHVQHDSHGDPVVPGIILGFSVYALFLVFACPLRLHSLIKRMANTCANA